MSGARRCVVVGLCLWGAGVQVGEALGAAGMGLAVVGLIWGRAPWARLRELAPGADATVVPQAGAAPPLPFRAYWPVWLFIGWALLAPLLAGGTPSSGGFFRVLDWGFVAVGAMAFAELDDRGRRAVCIACGAMLVASCAVAGLQFFGAWPSAEAMQPLKLLHPSYERVYEPASATSTDHFMAGGLLFHRLKFAGVSGVLTLWAVALAARLRGRERVVAAAVAAVGLLSVLVFPVVRAGALALLAAAAVTAAIASGERRRVALALAGGLLVLGGAAVGLNPEMRARVAAATSLAGDEDRVYLRRAGMVALEKHPLVGLGAGRYHAIDYMDPGAPADVKEHRGKAHLQLLSIAIETGIPGAALFLGMLVWMAVRLWPRGAAGLGVLVFLALMGLLHDPLFHPETSMAFAFALAAALGSSGRGGPRMAD
ncbi:MAG TPA: O-antigen ligase family protein [Myxococcales bacterium]|nr:O-antigen ligase family protein [Myxococcales bacterium]